MARVNELVAWLLEQIDHDERVGVLVASVVSDAWSEHSRRIVVQCGDWLSFGPQPLGVDGSGASFPEAAAVILRLLAVLYADRPGYLEYWRPA
jgi:hypothetical protein